MAFRPDGRRRNVDHQPIHSNPRLGAAVEINVEEQSTFEIGQGVIANAPFEWRRPSSRRLRSHPPEPDGQ